jgi:type VI secretion system protein ImpK
MRLIDCFLELITYVSVTVKDLPQTQPPYEKVRNTILRLISESETCLSNSDFSSEDIEMARFAIFAWIDEILLSFSWNGQQQWQKEQLQRIYFKTTNAGEEFFDRLNSLGMHQRDVREVFYLCLAMGFSGRYIHEDDAILLDQLRASNLKILFGSSVGVPSLRETVLFPESMPHEPDTGSLSDRKRRVSMTSVIGFCVPVAFFVVLYSLYALVLDGYSDGLFKMIFQ